MKKRILSMLLAIVMVVGLLPGFAVTASAADNTAWDGTTVATEFAGGTGSETDPYRIETAAQLIYFRNQVSTSSNKFSDKYIRLDADIDLGNNSFGNPIGIGGKPFSGTFDGNSKAISGLQMTASSNSVGLFGYVANATIKNLTIKDSSVSTTYSNGPNMGALVGSAYGCTIINCHNVNTSVTYAKTYSGNYGIGGLCGFVGTSGSGASAKRTSIDGCTNSGTVSGNRYIGGIFGYAGGAVQVTSCSNSGSVTSSDLGAGGIGGNDASSSTITGCVNTGTIKALYDAAGILGLSKNTKISKCLNAGTVTGTNETVNNQLLYLGAGGICGYADSYNNNATVITNCYNVGTVTAKLKVGGILGRQGNPGLTSNAITNCHNYGSVSTTHVYSANYIGAVVGCGSNTTVQNCYYLSGSAKNAKGEAMLGFAATTTSTINLNAHEKTATEFADGTVYKLLQGANTEQVWGQTIGTDDYPVFYNGSNAPVIKETVTITVTPVAEYTYDGTAKSGYASVSTAYKGDLEYIYKASASDTLIDAPKDAGTYTLVVKVPESDDAYKGESAPITFTIEPKEIVIEWSNTELTYNGSEQAPTATATGLEQGDTCIITVSGSKTNVGSNYTATASAVSNSNYELPTENTTTFAIVPANLSSVTLVADSAEFTGADQKPTIESVFAVGSLSVPSEAYSVTYQNSEGTTVNEITSVGNYTVVVTANANTNFTGSVTTDWTISKKGISPSVTLEGWTYGETAKTPSVTGNTGNGEVTYTYYTDNACTNKTSAAEGATVEGGVPKNADTYYVKAEIAATGDYAAGSATTSFTIAKKEVTAVLSATKKYDSKSDVIVTAAIATEDLEAGDSISISGVTGTFAQAGVGDIISVAVDSSAATITGADNYTVTIPATATGSITAKSLSEVTLTLNPSTFVFDGEAKKVSTITASFDDVTLVQDTDYTIDTSSVTEATAVSTGSGYAVTINAAEGSNYSGSQTAYWTITKGGFTATVAMDGYAYNGTISVPSVSHNPESGTVTYYYNTQNSNSDGTEWKNMTATSLDTGTYYMYAVIGETASYQSYTTEAVSFTVSKGTQTAPAPTGSYAISSADATKFVYTIDVVENAQYKMDDGSWQDSNVFDGIVPESSHTFYIKLKENTNYNESAPADAEVTFDKLANTTAPALAYTVSGDANARVITITEVEGAEYSFDGGSTWQTSNVKTGIDGTNDATKKVNITIRYKETAVYQPSTPAQTVEVDVTKVAQPITFDTTDRTATYGDGTLEARTATAEGAITYSSSDEAIATVDANGVVTVLKAGEVTITASAAETVDYAAGSASYKLTIAPKALTITVADKSAYAGNKAPDLSKAEAGKDYTVDGLVDGDSITVALSYVTEPDMNKAGEYEITATASDSNYAITVVNGKLKVSYMPYTPSTPTTQKVTVPISGDDETIHVDAKVKGDMATIDHVDLDHLDTVIGDHVEEVGTVTIDFSVLDKPVTTVEIPANAVKEIADAVNDPHNDAHSFEVILTDGTSIEFDAEALAEKAAQADGKDITISIESHEDATLTNAQKYVVGDHVAFDINVTSGGKHISDMGGKISVHVPYELKQGEDPYGIVVWYVDEFGNRERCETSYDPIKKRVNFKTDHLSLYMIDYDETLASNPFTDVNEDVYYFDSVQWAVKNGITSGITNTTFAPDMICTRAQAVTFLWRAAGSPEPRSTVMPFVDVAADSYYYDAVLWAVENGITNGTGADTFSPDMECSRSQIVTFLWRSQGAPVASSGILFTDVDVNAYYGSAVIWAVQNGVTNGTGANTFSPDAKCTRAQIVTFLYRSLAD